MNRILTLIAAVLLPGMINAADSGQSSPAIGQWSVETAVNTSRIIPTNSFLRTINGNDAIIAPDLRAGFAFSPHTHYGSRYRDVRQGLGLRLNNIVPHPSLGRPVDIYLYQSVGFAGIGRWRFSAEWNFGISAGWHKYDPEAPVANNAVGSSVNAILGVALAAEYRISPRWGLKASLNAAHYSNGNTSLPNAGVNDIGLAVGAQYYFDAMASNTAQRLPVTFSPGMTYDLTVYGAARKRVAADAIDELHVLPGHFGIAGINFAPMYAFNPYLKAGASLDMQYDESANLSGYRVESWSGAYEDLKFYRQPFSKRFAAGLSLRAELTLPIFSINIGIGRNIIAGGPDTRTFYQTLALKAYVWHNSFLQVGYQLGDFHLPNNLMLGIGYTFGRK